MDWKPISTAPYTGDLELAVIEKDGPHTVGFPCHRVVGGWIAAETNKWIKIRPTHWRVWPSPVKKLRHIQSSASNFPSRFALGEPLFEYGRIVMDWFSKKTSIAGIQLPNWMVVLGAIIVILLMYEFMQQAQIPH